jgi:hypothetical protein
MTEAPEARAKYYEYFDRQRGNLPESPPQRDFRVEGSRLLPTSRIDREHLERFVAELAPGDWVAISAINPIDCEKGKFLWLRCVFADEGEQGADFAASRSRFVTIRFLENNGNKFDQNATLPARMVADMFIALYETGKAPDFDGMPGIERVAATT